MSDLRAEAIQFIRAGLRVAADTAKTMEYGDSPKRLPYPFHEITVELAYKQEYENYEVLEVEDGVHVNFGCTVDRDVLEEVVDTLAYVFIEHEEPVIAFDYSYADRVLEAYDKAKAAEDALYDLFADTEEVSA